MRYHKAVGDDLEYQPSSIHFACFLPPDDFAAVLADIRNSITPSSVTVELDEKIADATSALTFGWEPDGSGMKWNNDKAASGKQVVKIDRVSFTSEQLQGGYDEDAERPTAPRLASNVQVIRELKAGLDSIRDDFRYYGRLLSVAVIAIVAILIYWMQQHMR
jgi:hypothetical protein